jgi:hypothetical protein
MRVRIPTPGDSFARPLARRASPGGRLARAAGARETTFASGGGDLDLKGSLCLPRRGSSEEE